MPVSTNDQQPHEEHQYLDLIKRIIETGQSRPDRTGTGTVALFAPPALRFSLANNVLPLLTTKRVFIRGVIEELLWFVRGSTDGKLLSDKDIHIWDGNGSREYLDKVGLSHRREGDLGPVYGFQWRHFGAEYKTCEDDYTGKGVDQLAQVIDKIKNNPTDRRIIMSAWNPAGEARLFVDRVESFVSLVLSTSQIYPLWLFHHVTCSANSTSHSPTLPLINPNSPVSCTNAPAISVSGFPSTSPPTPS